MSVEAAQAALDLAKAEDAWLKAKKAGKKNAEYEKAQAAVIAARDNYRNNHRMPGPGSANPNPVSMSLEVN